MEEELSKRSENKMKIKTIIIAAAERYFLEKDFEDTSMDDVAKEAGIAKRTLYKYFGSKEDLFFAVALKFAKQFGSNFTEALKNGNNALDKIRLGNKAYCEFYMDNPKRFRLMNYQPDNKLNRDASPNYCELERMRDKILIFYTDLIEEGKSDGSINENLNTKMAVYFGFCSSMGFLNMVSSIENTYMRQLDGINEREFLLFSMDLITDTLK